MIGTITMDQDDHLPTRMVITPPITTASALAWQFSKDFC